MWKKIFKINKKMTICYNVFVLNFAYLFTICNMHISGNKRLDVLINEKNIFWEVAIPKQSTQNTTVYLYFFENFAINV